MASLRLERLRKVFAGSAPALDDLDLEVADGELVVLVGPSGCGKSTALRLVAGLETPTSGRIWLGGRDVTRVPPRERDIAMVFQSYALYPHKTVRENLAFGLRMRRVPRAQAERAVLEVARTLGIDELLERRPAQLSGGQRQRVALGRALVREPRAFLLDEPLSNLDARLRVATRAELARLHRRLGATMLYVTHDQEEAMTLGDRIAVLREGRLQQCGPPLEVFERPANTFVATFIGSPAMNLVPGRAREDGSLDLEAGGTERLGLRARMAPGQRLIVGVRPGDLELFPLERAHARGRVEVIEHFGNEALVHVALEDGKGEGLRVSVKPPVPVSLEERIGLRFAEERVHLYDAASGERVA